MTVRQLKEKLKDFKDSASIWICDDLHGWKVTNITKDGDGDLIIQSDSLDGYINTYSME